jgi:hypothetical protein
MSVAALQHVFDDPTPVSGPLQLLLVVLAWRTRDKTDDTYPLTYEDLADLTHYSIRQVRRLVAEALDKNLVEIVWARPGRPTRYRVNRGDWHISRDEMARREAARRLTADQGLQGQLSYPQAAKYVSAGGHPGADMAAHGGHRDRETPGHEAAPVDKEEREKEKSGGEISDRRLAVVIDRISDRWRLR